MSEPDLGERLRAIQKPVAARELADKRRKQEAAATAIVDAIELELLEWAAQCAEPSRDVELTSRPGYVRVCNGAADLDPMHKAIARLFAARGVKAHWYERDQFEVMTLSWRASMSL